MSMLFPLMWLGAAMIAVPVVLHLRQRDETHLVRFSAMQFLEDQPLARSRPSWPRDWLLLILRITALTLLIAAFAWPYLEQESPVIVDESRVYILDNTMSNQRKGVFKQHRKQLIQEIESAGIRVQTAVIELTETARTLIPFGESGTVKGRIETLQSSDARGDYIDAFRQASELLETAIGKRKSIVLLGDRQANEWETGKGGQPFLPDLEVKLPDTEPIRVRNLRLEAPLVRRFVQDGIELVECRVMIHRDGSFDEASVSFSVAGERIGSQTIAFPDAEADTETISFAASWPAAANEWVKGTVRIDSDSDELQRDNAVVFSLPPKRKGRVLAIADSRFLVEALQPGVLQDRWDARLVETPHADDFGGPQAPDVVLIESHLLTNSTVRSGIRDTVNDGRGVILLVDRSSPLIAGFLRELGIGLRDGEQRSAASATFQYVFSEHPIFRIFRSSDFGDLTSITVQRFRSIEMSGGMPLAFGANGDPLIFESNTSTGRLLVFGFGFDRDDTNWPVHPTFVPFLDACLTHARTLPESGTSYEPAETVVWSLPKNADVSRIQVAHRLPDDDDRTGRTPVERFSVDVINRQVRFRLPPYVGHYELRYDDTDELQAVLDVNPSPLESDLIYESDPSVIDSWIMPSRTDDDADPAESNEIELAELEILQQHLWWWVLLAATGTLLIETFWVTRSDALLARRDD